MSAVLRDAKGVLRLCGIRSVRLPIHNPVVSKHKLVIGCV